MASLLKDGSRRWTGNWSPSRMLEFGKTPVSQRGGSWSTFHRVPVRTTTRRACQSLESHHSGPTGSRLFCVSHLRCRRLSHLILIAAAPGQTATRRPQQHQQHDNSLAQDIVTRHDCTNRSESAPSNDTLARMPTSKNDATRNARKRE
jgi:hypothetical protein